MIKVIQPLIVEKDDKKFVLSLTPYDAEESPCSSCCFNEDNPLIRTPLCMEFGDYCGDLGYFSEY